MKHFLCDRKIPNTDEVIAFEVEVETSVYAKYAAEELAYAVAFHRGLFPDRKADWQKPARWAMLATSAKGAA